MIRSRSIPLTAQKFIAARKDDVPLGRYAPGGDYLEYFIKVKWLTDPPGQIRH